MQEWERNHQQMLRAMATAKKWQSLLPWLEEQRREYQEARLVQMSAAKRKQQERTEEVGKLLLKNPPMTFAAIGAEVGLSAPQVSYIRYRHFADLPKRSLLASRSTSQERIEEVGKLLLDPDMTLAAIGAKVGLSISGVFHIRQTHFAHLPKRQSGPRGPRGPSGPQSQERIDAIGKLLLDPALSLAAIGAKVGVTRQRVQQIQQRYFPRPPQGEGGAVASAV